MRERNVPRTAPDTFDAERDAVVVEEFARGMVHLRSEVRQTVSRRLPIYAGLIYVIFCWALNTVLVKQAVATVDPMAFTFVRFLIMTPLGFVLARIAGERVHVARRDVPLLLLCGACGYGLYQYFWMIGLAHTTAFASALLSATSPIFTLAIVATIRTERVRSGRWLGVALALAGVAIYEGAFAGRAAFRIGDALTLCGALTFAGYNVVSARLLDRYTPVSLLAITMAVGTLMIAPGGIAAFAHTDFATWGWQIWWRIAFATLFPILLTYPVWSWAITQLGAGRVSIFSFLTPVLAGLLSVPILHARFAHYQLAGAAICLAGMILSNVLGRVSVTSLWVQRTLPLER